MTLTLIVNLLAVLGLGVGAVLILVGLHRDRETHRRGVAHPVIPFLLTGVAWTVSAMAGVFAGLVWWAIAIPAVGAAVALFSAQANYGCNERMRRSYGGWS